MARINDTACIQGAQKNKPLVIFFFNDTATTEIYTLSLHDALPISGASPRDSRGDCQRAGRAGRVARSEEHTSELQSRQYLVCRLLLEKKIDSIKYSLHSVIK